jgi:hypothetical protein
MCPLVMIPVLCPLVIKLVVISLLAPGWGLASRALRSGRTLRTGSSCASAQGGIIAGSLRRGRENFVSLAETRKAMRALLQIGRSIVLGIWLSPSRVWMVNFGEAVIGSVPGQLKIESDARPDGSAPSRALQPGHTHFLMSACVAVRVTPNTS